MERKWERSDVDLLMGDGDPELGMARSEMFPSNIWPSDILGLIPEVEGRLKGAS